MANEIGRVGWRTFVPTENPLWDNLLAYYSGDNTTNDAKGTYNGTLMNGATYATGKINNGFSFDGINDYVGFASNWFRKSKTEPFTISSWVNSSVHYGAIFSNGIDDGHLAFIYGRYIYLQMGAGLYNSIRVVSASQIPLNTFKHITITYNGNCTLSGFKIYIDGVSVGVNIAQGEYGPLNNLASNDTPAIASIPRIGSRCDGAYPFSGVLDEVGIWDRVITPTEVTELYNAGSGKQYVAPTPAYTTRTTAFAAATGITDATILNALNTFDTGLISNGLDTKMKALYPFVGGTATTHKFNFMDARDLNAAFRIQFNGGWVHSSTGAKGNGTNTYMNTFFNQFNNFTDWKKSTLGIYSRTNESGLFLEGNYGFNDSNFSLYTRLADGRFLFQAGAPFATAVTSDSLGFLVGSSISGSDRRVYKNGVKLATNTETNTFGVLPGLNTYFGALNGSGTATYISNKDYALAFLGESMTDADQSALYTLTQAMQTSLSRQV